MFVTLEFVFWLHAAFVIWETAMLAAIYSRQHQTVKRVVDWKFESQRWLQNLLSPAGRIYRGAVRIWIVNYPMSLKTFASEALANFYSVAAVLPSSIHLASAMVEPLPLSRTLVAIELGAGTGAVTRQLLNELPQNAKLLAFEINPRFISYLKQNFHDPRLVLINESGENVEPVLRQHSYHHVDVVVSSLGLGFMSDPKRRRILDGLLPFFRPHTVLTQYQYIHSLQFSNGRLRRLSLQPLLNDYFGSVESRIIWRNFPPAYVYTCHPQEHSCEPCRRPLHFSRPNCHSQDSK